MSKTYNRPSFTEIKARLEADLAALPAVLREPLVAAFTKVDHTQHGHLDWIRRQISPLECDEEMLPVWAQLYSIPRLNASFATGSVLAKGNAGSVLLIDTLLRGQNGLDYKVVEQTVLESDSGNVKIRCVTAGSDGNLSAGQTLTLIDPVLGIDDTLTVIDGITGGASEETIDAWRIRVSEEWSMATSEGARGGRPNDYRFWAKSAHQAVTGALVYPNALGPGTVIVYPICDGEKNRLPTEAILNEVLIYLIGTAPRYAGKAPATADVSVALAKPIEVPVSLRLEADFDTETNRTNITAAVQEAILSEDLEDSVLLLAELDAAISTVTTQYVRLSPVSDIKVGDGEILVFPESGIEWVNAS